MRRLPLFGTGTVGKSAVITSERRVNCYMEKRTDEDKAKMVVYGTPGLLLALSVGSGPSRGFMAANNGLYSVHGSTLYFINNSLAATAIGTLFTTNGTVSMDDSGTQLMLVDGTSGYYVT
jgi:hypothetical protein